MDTTFYDAGTASIANGATTVTFSVGSLADGILRAGDSFAALAQPLVPPQRLASAPVAGVAELAVAWPGTTLVAAAYEVRFTSDGVRQSERTRQLIEQMSVVEANGRGLFYRFSDSVTDADPGSGYLRLNNATIGSATAGYLDNLDANGATVSTILDTWDDAGAAGGRGQLWLRSIADPTAFHAFDVTGSVVDGTGYRKLTLEYIGGAGSFSADDELMVSFQPSGEAGLTGDAGVGGITLTFDSSTTDADPGAGDFRLNHATHASATAIYIDNVEALAGASITSLVDSWDDGQSTIKGTLTISAKANPAIFRIYNVTGSVVDGTGYRKLTIAYVTGAGTLTNTTSCSLQFAKAGNAGFTPGFRLAFSTTTADADPGAGIVRFNHATFASITQLFVDNADQGGTTITAWLDGLDDVVNANAKAYLRFEDVDDPTIYAEFAVTGAVTDGTGYRKIPVSPIVGVVPANGVVLAVNAAKSGQDGAGTVAGIVAGSGMSVDSSDPTAPIVALGGATDGERIGITSDASPLASPGALFHLVNNDAVTAAFRVTSYWSGTTADPFANNDDSLFEVFNETVSNSANRSWAVSAANAYNDIPAGVADTGTRVGVIGWAVSVDAVGYNHAGTLASQTGVTGRAGFQGTGSATTAVITQAVGVRGEVVQESTNSTITDAFAGLFVNPDGPGIVTNSYGVFAQAQGGVNNYSFYGAAGKFHQEEEANFGGALKQAGVVLARIRNISFGSSATEYTTTSASFVSTAGINVNALSTTSSLLVICAAQLENERTGGAGTTGIQMRLYRYTGTTFASADQNQDAQLIDTDAGAANITRGMATVFANLTHAQQRSDVANQWNINPHILSLYAGNTAKIKYHNMIFVEYEP